MEFFSEIQQGRGFGLVTIVEFYFENTCYESGNYGL